MRPGIDTIRTERLLLRPVRPGDADPFFRLLGNWEVVRWLSSPPWPYTLDDARAFVDAHVREDTGQSTFRAITLDDAPIGGIGVRAGNATEVPDRSPILGFWLGQPYWGRGYMTEAARGFIGCLFTSTPVDTVYTGAFADNAASLRVQEKLGFERTGEMSLYCRPHGKKRPHVNTKLLRSRFLAQPR
jgi:RimJ/RimL family protein N-acetyltransferase